MPCAGSLEGQTGKPRMDIFQSRISPEAGMRMPTSRQEIPMAENAVHIPIGEL